MRRQSLACCVLFVALAACEQEGRVVELHRRAPAPPPPPAFAAQAQDGIPETVLITGSLIGAPVPKLAYMHNLAIEMATIWCRPASSAGGRSASKTGH
jgi:hypothetical protein